MTLLVNINQIFFLIFNKINFLFLGESLSVEPIKNSLKLFEKWQVLECHPEENAKIYYLRDGYDNDEAANQIYESVEVFKWTKKN